MVVTCVLLEIRGRENAVLVGTLGKPSRAGQCHALDTSSFRNGAHIATGETRPQSWRMVYESITTLLMFLKVGARLARVAVDVEGDEQRAEVGSLFSPQATAVPVNAMWYPRPGDPPDGATVPGARGGTGSRDALPSSSRANRAKVHRRRT